MAKVTVSGQRALVAALLNASGLGAGYLYLRLWGLAVGVWLGTAALLVVATALNASGSPVIWLTLYLLWLALLVRDGWRRGAAPGSPSIVESSRRWLPLAVGTVLIALVATGLFVHRSSAQSELEKAERAHAAGRCEEALDHYERASRTRYEFTLAQAIGDARHGAESCELLLTAQRGSEQQHYPGAITAYESYLDRFDGGAPWAGAEQELITIRMAHADQLAARAVQDSVEAGDRYQIAAKAYLEVRSEHPDSPEAKRLAKSFEALYDRATSPWTEDDHPCQVLTHLEALAQLNDLDQPETNDLAKRASSAQPRATYDCGQFHRGEKAYCSAVDHFERTAKWGGTTTDKLRNRAERALSQSLYDCGLSDYREDSYASARDSFQRLVDEYPKDKHAGRAADLLIAIEIAEITEGDTGKLPPPTAAGGAPGGTVTVQIINDSPEALEILYTGTDSGRRSIEACDECTTEYSDLVRLDGYGRTCEADIDRPSVTLRLKPGDYEMVVSASSDTDVTPFSGTWNLVSGTSYSDCYYIESSGYGYGY